MLGLELVVVLGITVLIASAIAARVRVATPIVLLVAGVALGFVPALRAVQLPPDIVLLVFLPALLFWESLTTSLREIRRNLRGVVLMSTVLVVLTAAAAAGTAHLLGMAWGPAWVLGAAVAPTDATATAVLARALPRRNTTLLRAESLVNDGTALVLYGLAVELTIGSTRLTVGHVSGLVVLSYVGGVVAGLVVAWLAVRARRLLSDDLLDNAVSIITPFAAFLLAELVGASGVLAAVVAGLLMSQAGPRVGSAAGRQQSTAFWTVSTFLLNGALFVLVGVEVQSAVRGLPSGDLVRGILLVVVIAAVLFAVRLGFLFAAAYTIRLLDRRPAQRTRRVSNRSRLVSALAGFRGAVSLAAALAVPTALSSGDRFPDRDLLVFVTVGVIVVLLIPALFLPAVVRWAQLPGDSVADEIGHARVAAVTSARDAVGDIARDLHTDQSVANRVARDYDEQLRAVVDDAGPNDTDTREHARQYRQLELALLERKRATVIELRDDNTIDDTVLRDLQSTLDLEEQLLRRQATRSGLPSQ